jgi:hypothetical protein
MNKASAVDKDKDVLGAGGVDLRYETHEKITIAAIPYNTKELVESAFGKVKPYEHGILPVLVVIRTTPARLCAWLAQCVASDGEHVEAMPPDDVVRFQESETARHADANPLPIPLPRGNKKVR